MSEPSTLGEMSPEFFNAVCGPMPGVWIVWAASSHTEGVCGVWAEEVEALRFVNENGYGKAEFHEFGEIR